MNKPALVQGVALQHLDHQGALTFRLMSPTGQEWQVRPVLYHVAANCTGEHSVGDLAVLASEAVGEGVSEQLVEIVINWLSERGLLVGTQAKVRITPRAAFGQLRLPVLRGAPLNHLANSLMGLFRWQYVSLAVALSVAIRVVPYVSAYQQNLYQYMAKPWSVVTVPQAIPLFAITILIGLIHEVGHAAAARSVGRNVRAIGLGLHIIYPICYTHIDEVWGGSRFDRFVLSAGGIHFQLLAGSFVWLFYLLNPRIEIALLGLFNDLTLVYNFQPFLRFDGYWMLAHLSGVVNLARRGWGQLLEWFTGGRQRDPFLHTYSSWQRLVIAVYGLGNMIFMITFVWGLMRWSASLIRALPIAVPLLVLEGATGPRIGTLLQGIIWVILVFNIGRRWLLPLLRREVVRRVA